MGGGADLILGRFSLSTQGAVRKDWSSEMTGNNPNPLFFFVALFLHGSHDNNPTHCEWPRLLVYET